MKPRQLALPVYAFICLSYVVLPFAAAQSPAPRAITVDDAFEIHDVRDPQITDDGKWVAYTVYIRFAQGRQDRDAHLDGSVRWRR